MAEPARVAHIDELLSLPFSGGIEMRTIRFELGIGAFGVNAYTAADAGAEVIEDHDEVGAAAGRHEELYLVVAGHARFGVDGKAIDAPQGTLVFVGDPTVRRHAVAVADATTVLVVGARAGQPYAPSPWEGGMIAAVLAQRGDSERARALAAESLAQHPDHPRVLYNVACAEALTGDGEAAIEHLRRAVELEAQAAEWARGDSDFDAIRDDPRFPA
jgi:tetratricopeptide (TPR) repeat protein